jgi:hypothetical protein|tara:strand:+ start:2562 stop:2774 length:213 start_codon:yes stop_codon:yes gene_type:complete
LIIKEPFRAQYKNNHTKVVAEVIDKVLGSDGKISYYTMRNLASWKDALRRPFQVTPKALKEHWIELTNYE